VASFTAEQRPPIVTSGHAPASLRHLTGPISRAHDASDNHGLPLLRLQNEKILHKKDFETKQIQIIAKLLIYKEFICCNCFACRTVDFRVPRRRVTDGQPLANLLAVRVAGCLTAAVRRRRG
jgi:hypothetical protein